jgi:hypothetical protein
VVQSHSLDRVAWVATKKISREGGWLEQDVASPAAAGAFEVSGRGSGQGLCKGGMHTSDLVWQGAASGKASQRLGLCLAYVLGFCFGFWETRNDVEDLRGDNPEGFATGRA